MNEPHILIAEDSEFNHIILQHSLKELGYSFTIVVDGEQVLEKLKTDKSFNIVLMDLKLPIIDGIKATAIIRETFEEPQKNIKILAMTAFSDTGMVEELKKKGFDDFLKKPFTIPELKTIIEKNVLPNKNNISEIQEKTEKQESIIQLEYMQSLSGGDIHFENDLIQTYIDLCPSTLQRLRTLIDNQMLKELGNEAHKFASQTRFFGISASKELEIIKKSAFSNTNTEQFHILFSKIETVCNAAIKELEEYKEQSIR